MRTLSKAAEETLLAAIEKAAEYVNSGLAPNAAIIKSASDANIPAGHINLMVHAYNTGRTNKQREQGENTLEKAADFALADVGVVTDALFPKQVKTSQAMAYDEAVSTEYAVSPKGMLARRQLAQQKMAASAHQWPASTYIRPPRDDREEARRQYSQKVAEQREYEELRRQSQAAYYKAASAMDALHEYFRHPGNMAFQDAVAETELRVGDAGVAVLKKVAAVYPHLEKQAATNLAHFGPCEPVSLVLAVISAVEDYNAAEKLAAAKKKPEPVKKAGVVINTGSILYRPEDEPLTLKEAAIQGLDTMFLPDGSEQRVLQEAGYTPTPEEKARGFQQGYRPFGSARPKPPVPEKPEKAKEKPEPGRVSTFLHGLTDTEMSVNRPLSHVAGSLARSAMTPPSEMTGKALMQLTDPDHEMGLRNIRAQSVLNDLILNDPVISGHDPADVSLAFNELSELAPSMADSPAAMQALLRKRLEAGYLADFDVKQLMEMEKLKGDTANTTASTKQLQRELIK